jgi:hypothetical protein
VLLIFFLGFASACGTSKNDLLIIKPYFQQTELKEIVKMIDSIKSLPGSWVYLVLGLAGNRVTEQALNI